jgi:hypothetical protein
VFYTNRFLNEPVALRTLLSVKNREHLTREKREQGLKVKIVLRGEDSAGIKNELISIIFVLFMEMLKV